MKDREMRACVSLAVCLTLVGCSQDDQGRGGAGAFQPDQTCGLRVDLGGGLVASLTGADTELACVNPIGPTGIHTTFVPIHGALGHFQLDASGIEKGAIGEELDAEVRLVARDDNRVWNTAECRVDVTEHEYLRRGELGEQYRAVGSGRCVAPAQSVSGGDEPVTLGPFDFVVTLSWLGAG
jgi:hypothetical protein